MNVPNVLSRIKTRLMFNLTKRQLICFSGGLAGVPVYLLARRAAACVRAGYRKVLAAMPFGCLPGHIYARGVYAHLQRELPDGLIVGVDYGASTREGTVQNRIRMLLDTELL